LDAAWFAVDCFFFTFAHGKDGVWQMRGQSRFSDTFQIPGPVKAA
jgi:hypothetical protein